MPKAWQGISDSIRSKTAHKKGQQIWWNSRADGESPDGRECGGQCPSVIALGDVSLLE